MTNDSIRLHGTFSKPFSEKQHPVVVFIWRNGPHTRDQMVSGTPMFQVISDSLVARGYATLRIDKRGFGLLQVRH